MTIQEIVHLLAREYGHRPWRPHRDPISELILTILSQHTSDVNSSRAFEALLAKFDNWEAVAASSIEEIAAAIWPAGLARVKAPRIKLILERILGQRGSLDLAFLGELPLSKAKAWLERLPGVGPKTASCVLLFSLRRPSLPVDTHLYRVAKRLGLIGSRVSVAKAHQLLEPLVPVADIYQFHLNMVEHGRRVCLAQHPKCQDCVLKEGCPTGSAKLLLKFINEPVAFDGAGLDTRENVSSGAKR